MEINSDVKRDEVAGHVRELMEGEKGKAMKKKALEWKKMAEEATNTPDGSSYDNLNHIINQDFKRCYLPKKHRKRRKQTMSSSTTKVVHHSEGFETTSNIETIRSKENFGSS
ncbi:hypothetical protein Gorai_012563 [Gossypium raimondii]|nr:hypothetical protein [Gossypium raimondii]